MQNIFLDFNNLSSVQFNLSLILLSLLYFKRKPVTSPLTWLFQIAHIVIVKDKQSQPLVKMGRIDFNQ